MDPRLWAAAGALISDGRGLCATTNEYLAENGVEIEREETRRELMAQLGCDRLAVVPALLDEPTRHIDMFAQFLGPERVAVASLLGRNSLENAERMSAVVAALEDAASRAGDPLEIVRVPGLYLGTGQYRTYLNGLKLQSTFLAPSYSDVPAELETRALSIMSAAMPSSIVVPIAADEMIRHLGAVHCASLGVTWPSVQVLKKRVD